MSGHYERLSYLDNSFLALERRSTHMHVGSIALFEAGPLRTADGGVDTALIRQMIESKLELIPRYRQRLARVPLEKHPVWVDDEHFNIEYHVRHYSLPRPGSTSQLKDLVGIIVSQQLDRSKPLWELNIVEGLEDDRFALVSKIHHCMIDGIAGVDLMAVLLNLAPSDEVREPKPYLPRPAPSGSELLIRETARRTGRVLRAARSVRQLSDDALEIAGDGLHRVRAAAYSLASGWLTKASDTPLNGDVGPNRLVGTLSTPLSRVKEIKNNAGGSVNDVVLATVAGGVRRFLMEARGYEFDALDFRAMAPVSVRSHSERGTLGNQVAMWLVSLPVAEPDPRERLEAVKRSTHHLKETNQALGAATLVRLSAGGPATLVSMASRLATGVRPFNMTVTNVPGPQFPLYLLGSRMLESYALVPLWYGHGIGVALFSYAGQMYWGFNADYDIVPDVDEFAASIDAAFDELHDASSSPPAPASRPKKRPPLGTVPGGDGGQAPPSASKRTAAKTTAAKTTAAKTTAAKRTAAKKTAAKKTAPKKTAPKKTAAKKAASKKKTEPNG
jgi:WS/DGAT/MGAT family acyltransferase